MEGWPIMKHSSAVCVAFFVVVEFVGVGFMGLWPGALVRPPGMTKALLGSKISRASQEMPAHL
jgi:hypothetical protein